MTQKLGKSLLYAFILTLISICIFSLIITTLAYFEVVSIDLIEKMIYFSYMIIFFFSAMFAAKIMQSKGWLVGGIFALTLIFLSALYHLIGVEHGLNTAYFIRSLLILVLCTAGGMLGVNLPQKS